MRDKKFKAYCDEHGFSEPFELGEANLSFPKTGLYHPLNLCTDFCEIVQYTGLKDKNGKEIYEGDIMEWPSDLFCMAHSAPPDFIRRGLVIFHQGQFMIKHYPDIPIELTTHIGNIHENPDLLKSQPGPATSSSAAEEGPC